MLPMLVMAAAVAAAQGQVAPAAQVDDLAWMAGYWLDCSRGREASETWSDPRAGLMVGHAVTVRDGRAGFEVSHIRAGADGRLVYFAQPDGASPTPFALVDSGPGRARFENPDPDDFPRHILYARDGEALTARIEGEIDGRPRTVEWRFAPADLNARCPR